MLLVTKLLLLFRNYSKMKEILRFESNWIVPTNSSKERKNFMALLLLFIVKLYCCFITIARNSGSVME